MNSRAILNLSGHVLVIPHITGCNVYADRVIIFLRDRRTVSAERSGAEKIVKAISDYWETMEPKALVLPAPVEPKKE